MLHPGFSNNKLKKMWRKKRPTDKTYMNLGIKTNRQDIYGFKNPEVNNRPTYTNRQELRIYIYY